MARKTGTHTYFASPRTERTRISIEVPLMFRDNFVDAAYKKGMTQFEYLAHLFGKDNPGIPPAPNKATGE